MEFLEAQVRAAAEMADLELRLQGVAAAEGLQRIRDARAAAESRKLLSSEGLGSQRAIIIPPRGTLGKSVRMRSGRVLTDEEAEDKVLRVLMEELLAMEAPVLETIRAASDQARAQRALMGQLRLSTIRRYLAYWQRFRQWVHA